jgi:hypothetical protein
VIHSEVPGSIGNPGRGAVDDLDLRRFVHAQHQGILRRVQVQADDITDLVDELRVGGQPQACT